ncbi:RNA polymerase sigma factor [Microbacterium resistens]|uniref:RNA polymerase sigma factor n=1 Tax=Microbacterium resistens TaxID=156977 RepID=A0ABY3RW56_9MICO|nr:RNA polymerase sigma factor [Microbacterium resistens]UGS27109.1 RNA polymerase sigma factor [Microbacterium resistens]
MSTDSEIMRRSLDHPSAFAEVFDRHARAIGAYAARRVGPDAAEDVLSETFLVAFRRRAAFDRNAESALPWLFGIASRLVRTHRAREARQWRTYEASVSRSEHVQADETEELHSRLDAEAEVHRLAGRIAALSTQDRDTLLLHAWGDLTYEQIAEALRVPVGTVRSRLNRVRRRLDDSRSTRIRREDVDGRLA